MVKQSFKTNRTEKILQKIPLKKLITWICVHISYTFLGSLLFIYVEECHGNHSPSTSQFVMFKKYLAKANSVGANEMKLILNATRDYFVTAPKKQCDFSHDSIAKWWKFTTVTCYTIGYGTIVPKTDSGKIVTIIYATIGIPLTVALYTVAAEFTKGLVGNVIRLVEMGYLKRDTIKHIAGKTLATLVILLIAFLFIVSYVSTLKQHGNLSVIDSVYFWFQTLTTIGYGDVYPAYPHNDFAEILLKITFAFGMGITASIISAIASLGDEINRKNMIRVLSSVRRKYNFQESSSKPRRSQAFEDDEENARATKLEVQSSVL